MNQAPQLDMSLIREALARRGFGGGVGGGSPIPAVAQTTVGAPSPLGTPGTPTPGNPLPATPSPSSLPVQVPQGGGQPNNPLLKAAQTAQSPAFDPETSSLAKSLIQRLLKAV